MIDLEARRETIASIVQQLFLEQGELLPMAVLVAENGDETAVSLDTNGLEAKQRSAGWLYKMVQEDKPVMLALALEAWQVAVRKVPGIDMEEHGAAELAMAGGTLENHPERTEIISLAFETPQHCWHWQYPIIRDGDKVTLGEVKKVQSDNRPTEVGGRFSNFFGTEEVN